MLKFPESSLKLQEKADLLKKSIEDTSRVRDRLESERSDLEYYLRLSDQNIRTLKKTKMAVMASEFSKIKKAHKEALDRMTKVDEEFRAVSKSIANLTKVFKNTEKQLEIAKESEKPKILEFRKKKL